ncbi:MAG: Mrp/NBP35 family ATP-binding protein, partial [Muribaculaceae bacterium]|nr:Mrp/NBP35 family ATP-binding protein [Muribaculaceae bacterium]
MFKSDKINVPILGLVENMAWFTPAPHPEEKYYIFGNGGAVKLAEELDVKLLAQIPLVADICSTADLGAPTSVALVDAGKEAENPEAKAFGELAEAVVKACDERNAQLPPTTVVQTH